LDRASKVEFNFCILLRYSGAPSRTGSYITFVLGGPIYSGVLIARALMKPSFWVGRGGRPKQIGAMK